MIPLKVLSLGAGWQSTTLLVMSLDGILPMLDAAIFADTQWEPKKVYEHLEFLKTLCAGKIPLYITTAGNLRKDAVDFRRMRRSEDVPSSTGRRYASIPVFVKNRDGTKGKVRRQCTREYKIEPVERIIRQQLLKLRHGQKAPKFPVVEHWFGISTDEAQRAVHPGKWVKKKMGVQGALFGEPKVIKAKRWVPTLWETHVYPLMDVALLSNRTSCPLGYMPRTLSRHDCGDWLKRRFPDRDGQGRRGLLVGETFVHQQLIPLDMVNLDGAGMDAGTSCGMLGDGQDGLCGI